MKNYVFTITVRGILDCALLDYALTFLGLHFIFPRGLYETPKGLSVFPERAYSPLGLFV